MAPRCNKKLIQMPLGNPTQVFLENGQVWKGILLPTFEDLFPLPDSVEVRRIQFSDQKGLFIPHTSKDALLGYFDRNPRLLEEVEGAITALKEGAYD